MCENISDLHACQLGYIIPCHARGHSPVESKLEALHVEFVNNNCYMYMYHMYLLCSHDLISCLTTLAECCAHVLTQEV